MIDGRKKQSDYSEQSDDMSKTEEENIGKKGGQSSYGQDTDESKMEKMEEDMEETLAGTDY